MMKSIPGELLGDLYYKLTEDDKRDDESQEGRFYWDKIFDDLKKYADPQYDDIELSDHFYNLIVPMCRAYEIEAFSMGVSFALKLSAQAFSVPRMTYRAAAMAYANDSVWLSRKDPQPKQRK